MCEQTEIDYLDGEVVWVKLGSCWWPGEVIGPEKLPPDVMPSFRKPPIAVVKFYQEDTYEYVKNINSIYKYNCSRKTEFIKKGLYMYRTKHGHMEKFPEDVIRAETATGGDIEILTRDEFQEMKKESYAGIFGDPVKKTPISGKRGRGGRGRPPAESPKMFTPIRKINKGKSDYKVHILVQGSKTPSQSTETTSIPSTSRADSEPSEEAPQNAEKPVMSAFSTPTASSSGIYSCHACAFTTSRMNVMILHNKTHSVTFTPYTPSPVRKKLVTKSSTPNTSKIPKVRRPRKEKTEKVKKLNLSQKRSAENQPISIEVKRTKTDEEIKSSLLADWDDVDEESIDESSTMIMVGSPEVPVAAESPAVPTPAELSSAQVPSDVSLPVHKKSDDLPASEKPESSSDSKYEFCEDEDWSLEADAGRKIPRVKNPKRKDDTKSVSLDEDDVAREVAELLNKTTVPELPSAPEPLKVEENFPEPSIVKSPDKNSEKSPELTKSPGKTTSEVQQTKAIFKTKTFFRSRHSRSQDAIGKYVAEQLNAAERLDTSESEINGSEVVSSPEARESPPVEHIKVARLAPKIQLKKMKAEAAQLREKEKSNLEPFIDDVNISNVTATKSEILIKESTDLVNEKENTSKSFSTTLQDVLYPTQEIKPINKELSDEVLVKEDNNKENIDDKTTESKDTVDSGKNNKDFDISYETVNKKVNFSSLKNISESSLQKSYEQSVEPYMNESTASAVDALLSVSRETDRVTKVISDDPPEDLFEDDNKDNGVLNNINGLNETLSKDNIQEENEKPQKQKEMQFQNDLNGVSNQETSCDNISQQVLSENSLTGENKEKSLNNDTTQETVAENIPSESDLQIAEALINLPSTAVQNKTSNEHQENLTLPKPVEKAQFQEETANTTESVNIDNDKNFESKEDNKSVPEELPTDTHLIQGNENRSVRFETEQEKSENLNAAQSLVQMSESIDHNINIVESNTIMDNDVSNAVAFHTKQNNSLDSNNTVEQKVALLSSENNSDTSNGKTTKFETTSSKLLKILEEPCAPKVSTNKTTTTKQVVVSGKEKILNFDVGKSSIKSKPQSPKQTIIIRRNTPSKNLINNLNEVPTPDKIILSRSNKAAQDGSSVQTYTIQASPETPSDANTIIIQQKIRKIAKTSPKLQKIKSQVSLVTPLNESKPVIETPVAEDAIYDINSMPIVLSDEILTPESIEKMPIVMSDGNIIANPSNPPKLVKTKQTINENEKIALSSGSNKKEIKTLLMNPVNEVSKVTTPNILSKSSKLRGAKPMLVIDKTTGKKKIIMTEEPTVKEVKQTPPKIQSVSQNTGKTEKFIILPTSSSPRPGRTQKIVIDPQTGKAHVLVAKGSDSPLGVTENKAMSAKLIPSASDANSPGNTVMIITNAQGAQSRIVLTPEHEKILFPNKQQTNVSQLKTIAHRITTNSGGVQKTVVTTVAPTKTQTRIVQKQKSAIITSKGQLIVGGRVATTTQNVAPMPEIRPAPPKRLVAAEPKKLVQTIQKNTSEPLIFLQQKSGAVMQLTAAQFEHLQRTGQIDWVQKTPAPVQENKIIVQKSVTISPNETAVTTMQKQRVKRQASDSPTSAKKVKQEIAIAPAPAPSSPMPALTPLSNIAVSSLVPPVSNTVSVTTSSYPDLDNFEELLPSTAIVRQTEPIVTQPEQSAAPPPAPLSDGQLLAVPGEHFGGPQGSFYLCVEDNGTLTPIDNRPLVLENNQLVPMAVEPLPVLTPQPERRDILEAALANSDVFHAETPRDEAPDFRDLNANVSVHCRVSETSTTLNQPIMTPVEMPTKADSEPAVPSNLEDGLAVIGVTPQTVPTSLELPITVTDPRIAPKTTDPLSRQAYGTTLLPSPNTEMTFVTTEDTTDVPVMGPISMPLLTEEESVGKSMPILTDEVTERTASSVDSTVGSPSSVDVRESETEEGGQWTRRLLTPGSDTSETSAEIPLQPAIQLSVNDLSQNS